MCIAFVHMHQGARSFAAQSIKTASKAFNALGREGIKATGDILISIWHKVKHLFRKP